MIMKSGLSIVLAAAAGAVLTQDAVTSSVALKLALKPVAENLAAETHGVAVTVKGLDEDAERLKHMDDPLIYVPGLVNGKAVDKKYIFEYEELVKHLDDQDEKQYVGEVALNPYTNESMPKFDIERVPKWTSPGTMGIKFKGIYFLSLAEYIRKDTTPQAKEAMISECLNYSDPVGDELQLVRRLVNKIDAIAEKWRMEKINTVPYVTRAGGIEIRRAGKIAYMPYKLREKENRGLLKRNQISPIAGIFCLALVAVIVSVWVIQDKARQDDTL